MTEEELVAHRIGMAELTGTIKVLASSVGELKEMLKEQGAKIDGIEQRSQAACKSCDLRVRVSAVETNVGKIEVEQAGFTGRAAGIAIAAAVFSFLASLFVMK